MPTECFRKGMLSKKERLDGLQPVSTQTNNQLNCSR